MIAGGRLPPTTTAVRDCAAWSALPISSSFAAASMARCASAGSCFFLAGFLAASGSPLSPSAFCGGAFLAAALGGAWAWPCVAQATATPAAASAASASLRQSPIIEVFPRLASRRTRSTSRTRGYANSPRLCKSGGPGPRALLHRDRLGKVAGLVHVRAHEHRGVVGDELHGHRVEQRVDEGVHLGDGDILLDFATGALLAGVGDEGDLAAARGHPLHVGEGLLGQGSGGGHHDRRHVLVDEGDGAVLEL